MVANDFIGAAGMTLLEYLIPSAGASTYYGPVTGATYLFGGRRVRGYVDNRDVDKMLEMREGRHQAFRVAQESGNTNDANKNESRETAMANDLAEVEAMLPVQMETLDVDAGAVLAQRREELEESVIGNPLSVTGEDDALGADDEESVESDTPVVTKSKTPRKSTSRKKHQ